ncbi:MAG TPA: pitrilysin family protein [Kofleriaceae bacterium]|nr:pitrilysin family protein [Kofleriaceae bacterium]
MNRRPGLWVSLCALLLSLGAAPASADRLPERPWLAEWQLPNGLKVAYAERANLPMAVVQVWYRFGSKDEPAGQRGSARAFEKLMFLGSERVRPEDHRRFIERVGGETTALTTEDVTAYHQTVPVEYLDLALELEAERMRSLLIRPESVDVARAFAADEARKQESSPLYRAYLTLMGAMFAGHAYAWAPSGVRSEIEGLSGAGLKLLYDAYYQPSNAMLVIVSSRPADDVKKSVERWFGGLKTAQAPKHPDDPAGAGVARDPAKARVAMQSSSIGLVMTGYKLPAASHADLPALQLCGAILSAGPSSRLHKKLVEGKLAVEIGGQVLSREGGGALIIYARLDGGDAGAVDKVEKAMLAEIERLATAGPTPAELARARGQVLGASLFGGEGATGVANQVGVSWALTGRARAFEGDQVAVRKATAATIKKAAASYLSRGAATVVVANPGGAK